MAGEIRPDSDFVDAEIIFVMGGPGAGKTTLCARLAEDLGLIHLCPGQMLRKIEETGPLGTWNVVKDAMHEGKLCPIGLIMHLLQREIVLRMRESGARTFLIDGFPRSTEQFFDFSRYCEAKFSLCIKCAPTTLHDRFTKPAIIDDQKNGTSTSPDDDRLEVEFRKRMNQFSDANAQVIGYLDSVGRVVTIDGELPLEECYAAVRAAVETNLARVHGGEAA